MRVVLDWDGTSTTFDTMVALVRRFGDADIIDSGLAGRSLHEAIEAELGSLRVGRHEAVEWLLENAEVRPGLHELIERHRPLILSMNVRELIEPILAREGLTAEVVAHGLAGDEGWEVEFRDEDPCAVCGEPCKRGALPGGEVVYVGDGWSDQCAALAAERVFATGPLARYLEREGVPFERFDDLHEVADALAAIA